MINILQKAIPAVVIVAVFIVQILTSQTEEIFEREMCGDAVALTAERAPSPQKSHAAAIL